METALYGFIFSAYLQYYLPITGRARKYIHVFNESLNSAENDDFTTSAMLVTRESFLLSFGEYIFQAW